MPTIDPNVRWRLLIKEMGGSTGVPSANKVTVNSTTFLWTTNATTGIIDPYPHAETIAAGGPYAVETIIVPYDPVHATGGSFYRFLEGPGVGKLVSFWTNSLGYGSITVSQTSSYDRGPGDTVLTLEYPAAHSCDANLNYNAAGEMHFTLLVDDPNIDLLRPKRQHYAIEFLDGLTWVEVFAGVLWDFEATDTEVIYYGIDYLGLLKFVWDERFDPNAPKKPYPIGSLYEGTPPLTISDVVTAHLTYATGLADSLVSFIAVGSVATMSEEVTIYSTMSNAFDFIMGLLDSHRAGTGKFTRLSVQKIAGVYTFVVTDDPGVHRDDLALQYVPGGLVTGYKAIPFGPDWASRVNYVGKARDGGLLMYHGADSAVDQSEWGRVGQAPVFIESHDENDLLRRARQGALDASKLGRSISAGLRLGSFRPLQGYDICDQIPVGINHGAVVTGQWGSDDFGADPSGDPSAVEALYWSIIGVTFASFGDGHWTVDLGLWPTGGGAPLSSYTTTSPITPQTPLSAGNGPPDPTNTSSETYIDLTTGQQYVRNDVTDTWDLVPGTRLLRDEPGALAMLPEQDYGFGDGGYLGFPSNERRILGAHWDITYDGDGNVASVVRSGEQGPAGTTITWAGGLVTTVEIVEAGRTTTVTPTYSGDSIVDIDRVLS